jgi:hypothetical protein
MISPVDHVLAKARLTPRPYTTAEMEAAEIRLAARLADRMVDHALAFDDRTEQARDTTIPRPSSRPHATAPCPRGLREEAARDLKTLCRAVIGQGGALHQMSAFITSCNLLEPVGARVLGCVLQLADREDAARFWWQFAAGAGDTAAAYCLYLHHMSLGENGEAEWWHLHADVDHRPHTRQIDALDLVRALRLLGVLRGEGVSFTPATAAVIDYVPGALQFVDDDVDLPLPEPNFAQRIEELTAAA